MRQKDIRRFMVRAALFSLPVMALFLVELFVLPIDYFTFRAWEALHPAAIKYLPGAFYPDQSIQREVPGGLAPHTKYARYREVLWQTDRYGFRNRPTDQEPAVVLVGDSNIAGIKLDQDETLSEVLQQKLGKPVYSYAPAPDGLLRFVHDKRFQKSPPDVVILQGIERNHHVFQPIDANQTKEQIRAYLHQVFLSSRGLTALAVTADRVLKWPMYRYFKAGIDRKADESPYHRIGSKFFFQGEEAFKERSPEYIAQVVQVLEGYKEALEDQDIRFVFLPVPNKENIYHGLFPNQKKPQYLSRLIAALQEKGVEVIDTQTAFDKAFQEGAQLYPCDDAHWNPEGVRITAELIAEALGNNPTEPEPPSESIKGMPGFVWKQEEQAD